MHASILHKGLWFTVGHLVQNNATREGSTGITTFPTALLAYRNVIYPHGMTSKYGLRGRLGIYLTNYLEPEDFPPELTIHIFVLSMTYSWHHMAS